MMESIRNSGLKKILSGRGYIGLFGEGHSKGSAIALAF